MVTNGIWDSLQLVQTLNSSFFLQKIKTLIQYADMNDKNVNPKVTYTHHINSFFTFDKSRLFQALETRSAKKPRFSANQLFLFFFFT